MCTQPFDFPAFVQALSKSGYTATQRHGLISAVKAALGIPQVRPRTGEIYRSTHGLRLVCSNRNATYFLVTLKVFAGIDPAAHVSTPGKVVNKVFNSYDELVEYMETRHYEFVAGSVEDFFQGPVCDLQQK